MYGAAAPLPQARRRLRLQWSDLVRRLPGDTTAFSGQKFDALAAHASQGENIFFLKMGKERFSELMSMETFVRVKDATGTAVPENDLFAGLR